MLAICVAEGIPAPNVTFENNSTPLDDYNPPDYDVTVTHVNNTTTRTEVFIGDPNIVYYVYYFRCVANSSVPDFKYRIYDDLTMYVNPEHYR